MTYKDLKNLSPEQVFLIQGNEGFAKELIETIHKELFCEERILSRFTKDDAAFVRSYNLERKGEAWLVVFFAVFQNDAAESLLKTLEEPNEGIHIVFITPHPYLVPQTIRSRVRILTESKESLTEYKTISKKEVDLFIKEKLTSETIDPSEKRAYATAFLDAIENTCRKNPEKAKVLYEAKDMLYKANMPTKQVIEYVASLVF